MFLCISDMSFFCTHSSPTWSQKLPHAIYPALFKKLTDVLLSNFQDMLSINRKGKNEYITQKNAYSPKILHQVLVWGHF